jgi:hypothetical protein
MFLFALVFHSFVVYPFSGLLKKGGDDNYHRLDIAEGNISNELVEPFYGIQK